MHETVLGDEDQLELGDEVVVWVEGCLELVHGVLQRVGVHGAAHVVPDEGLRVPHQLQHQVQRLRVPAAGAAPHQGAVRAGQYKIFFTIEANIFYTDQSEPGHSGTLHRIPLLKVPSSVGSTHLDSAIYRTLDTLT